MSSTAVEPTPRTSADLHSRQPQQNEDDFRVPAPKHRHATPSAPWPWMDFTNDSHQVQQQQPDGSNWDQYPQNLFGNWTNEQVERSEMLTQCDGHKASTVHRIGVFDDGKFGHVDTRSVRKDDVDGLQEYWDDLKKPPPSNMRIQAFLVENMSTPLLQMLGTRYEIEPFFFASSTNWIPSRYQEDPKICEDHITVILPFIHISKANQPPIVPIARTQPVRIPTAFNDAEVLLPYREDKQTSSSQAAVFLPENRILVQDLLSLHMVRNAKTSTIISYPNSRGTTAKRLRSLVQRTGDSVYWSKLFQSGDSTFLFLAVLWYALYAWDEAFEALLLYIIDLEHDVLKFDDIDLAEELHTVQEHLLQYEQLLGDFLQSVEFVRDTPNPAMNDPSIPDAAHCKELLRTEADNLISEVERLNFQRDMMYARVKNSIHLAYATVIIKDTRLAQTLSERMAEDSSSMKQIAYLTMTFVPATFLANVFSMNLRETIQLDPKQPQNHPKHTYTEYIVFVVCFTLFTSWLAIVIQKESTYHKKDSGIVRRILWPFCLVYDTMSEHLKSQKRRARRSIWGFRPSRTVDEEQLMEMRPLVEKRKGVLSR